MLRTLGNFHEVSSSASALLVSSVGIRCRINQKRGRRRVLKPPPWVPPIHERTVEYFDPDTAGLLQQVIEQEKDVRPDWIDKTSPLFIQPWSRAEKEVPKFTEESCRVGLIARKIGMVPQWLNDGTRLLCTILEFPENQVVSAVDPNTWYRCSLVGKRKAFNRFGASWKVTVGAVNGNPAAFTHVYRSIFERQGIPVKETLGSFLVSEDAVLAPGTPLHVCHFTVGQHVAVSGKSIDWGFQGVMHRWGMRGQPARNTTKSHRRVGAIGTKGDGRVLPGKRLPGHMGYEWSVIPALQVLRINPEKQVMYIKGSVPGEIGEMLLVKDSTVAKKRVKNPPFPTFFPKVGSDESNDQSTLNSMFGESVVAENDEIFLPKVFRFTSPSIVFTAEDETKSAGRDKTRAKIAKVKK